MLIAAHAAVVCWRFALTVVGCCTVCSCWLEPVSCGITSSVEMRPGDVIFTSGGTQLVTDMRPMCRNNVRLQQRDENYRNGLTERFNQTLSHCLISRINEAQTDWDEMLDPILFSYRVSRLASTNYSPYFLMFVICGSS